MVSGLFKHAMCLATFAGLLLRADSAALGQINEGSHRLSVTCLGIETTEFGTRDEALFCEVPAPQSLSTAKVEVSYGQVFVPDDITMIRPPHVKVNASVQQDGGRGSALANASIQYTGAIRPTPFFDSLPQHQRPDGLVIPVTLSWVLEAEVVDDIATQAANGAAGATLSLRPDPSEVIAVSKIYHINLAGQITTDEVSAFRRDAIVNFGEQFLKQDINSGKATIGVLKGLYVISLSASCFVQPESPFPDSAECSATADPILEFDQETFDILMGENTFPLAEAFTIEYSPNILVKVPEPGTLALTLVVTSLMLLRWRHGGTVGVNAANCLNNSSIGCDHWN